MCSLGDSLKTKGHFPTAVENGVAMEKQETGDDGPGQAQ